MKRVQLIYLYANTALLSLAVFAAGVTNQRNKELSKQVFDLNQTNFQLLDSSIKCGGDLLECRSKLQWCRIK